MHAPTPGELLDRATREGWWALRPRLRLVPGDVDSLTRGPHARFQPGSIGGGLISVPQFSSGDVRAPWPADVCTMFVDDDDGWHMAAVIVHEAAHLALQCTAVRFSPSPGRLPTGVADALASTVFAPWAEPGWGMRVLDEAVADAAAWTLVSRWGSGDAGARLALDLLTAGRRCTLTRFEREADRDPPNRRHLSFPTLARLWAKAAPPDDWAGIVRAASDGVLDLLEHDQVVAADVWRHLRTAPTPNWSSAQRVAERAPDVWCAWLAAFPSWAPLLREARGAVAHTCLPPAAVWHRVIGDAWQTAWDRLPATLPLVSPAGEPVVEQEPTGTAPVIDSMTRFRGNGDRVQRRVA